MKKTVLAFLLTAAVCSPSFGWGRLGHATINKIAEDHLTKTARKALDRYMNGESIVTFASYPDDYRARLNESFRPAWNEAKVYSHTYEVDGQLVPFRGIKDGDRDVTNSLYFIAGFIDDLGHAESLDAGDRFIEIAMLCHFIGDMHCPSHVRYQPERDIASWKVTYLGEPSKYHKVWDGDILKTYYPWSWSDFAEMCDICTEKEIAEIVEGDIFDWGHDVALTCLPVRSSVKEGDVLKAEWAIDRLDLARMMIRRGGYRLAHTLNMIFDPKYARKHKKQ